MSVSTKPPVCDAGRCCRVPDAGEPDPADRHSEATLGAIVRLAGSEFLSNRGQPLHVHRVLSSISLCCTPALGGHHYRCARCGKDHQISHGCGNRHCPQCQSKEARQWLEKQSQALLPAGYFHLVFTLPHEFNPLVSFNRSPLYNLLFQAVSNTLLEFGRNNLGGQIGFTAVLHTWSQTLFDHYHLHVIVPAGALCEQATRWKASHPRYLFAIKALSKVYRAKFLAGLQHLFVKGQLKMCDPALERPETFQGFLDRSARKNWNVFAKRPFAGPEEVLRYLSLYTHRIAISNKRILEVDPEEKTVLFSWKDYADSNKQKTMRVSVDEFLRRFCLHILPQGFVRIRHYGFLSNNSRAEKIPRIRELLGAPAKPAKESAQAILEVETGKDASPRKCPYCGSGDIELVAVIRRPRRSANTPPNTDASPRAPPLTHSLPIQ